MNSSKADTVCGPCFLSTKNGLPAKLSKSQCKNRNEVICKTCRKKWNSINVAFSVADNTWYQIRSRPNKHKTDICRAIINNKTCPTGIDCKFPHNFLEKDVWEIGTENVFVKKDKFLCFVCNITFQQQKDLNAHMNSFEHGKCAEKKHLLPKVGSSTEFRGLIRDRPNLPQDSVEYQLCSEVTKGTKCRFRNACKFAHSIEERTAWNEALQAENEDIPVGPVEERNWNVDGDTRRGNTFIKKEDTTLPRTPSKQRGKPSPTRQIPTPIKGKNFSNNIPKFIREINRDVSKKEISCYLKNYIKHIRLHCDTQTDVTINANSTDDVIWIVRLTAHREEQLNGIVLYNHRNCFQIGQIVVRNSFLNKQLIHTPLHPTGTKLELDLHEGVTVGVPVTFTPQPGEYNVYVIFQLIYGTLLAFQLQVKVVEERFIAPTKQFTHWLTEEKKSIQQSVPRMKVLWEHEYKIILYPSHRDSRSTHNTRHPVPNKMETRISSGTYNTMDTQLTADTYKQRFHELLFLEEYEHRKRLVKYDLQDYDVTFDTATKQISYSTPGSQRMKTAPQNLRYITFKLKYSLFEGYRSYKPPTQAFLIPNGTNTAYECSYFVTGVDLMHFLVTEAAVAACEETGGKALVRFTSERDEYVRMHDALDKINPRVMFPVHKKIPIRGTWEERAILEKVEKENLSASQKEAIYSIVDTEYQTFPTIVCGPFGCGKTRTLAIAARLIALNFHGAKVLVVTKNNSCANLFIQLLSESRQFDSIVSYRNKILTDIANVRPILYRHFARSAKIASDKTHKSILEYTQYRTEGDTPIYKILNAEELLICSVIVTTTHGCFSLVQLREELKRELDLFTHVFIDEAAQIIEPDACIPLHFANDKTKIVLAGDIYQTRPLILSPLAIKHGMDKSVLERFSELGEYDTNPLSKCRIELKENFRSQEPIVKFLSKLFYNNSITANPPVLTGPSNLPYLSMVHVNGEEKRIEIYGHVSYWNQTEAQLTLKAVERFVIGGVDPTRIVVLSTYRGHVNLIETYLRSNKCRGAGHHQDRTGAKCRDSGCVNDKTIQYSRLEGIQGLEYDVLIINTVRTIHTEPSDLSLEGRLDLGLLDDIAQFNTVLTRARGWVMVIGDTECLTAVGRCSEMWRQYRETCSQLNGFFPNGDITARKYDELFETSGLSGDDVVERDEEKSTLLEKFISICFEELCSSVTLDNSRKCQSLSEQIELAERALSLINEQTENTREQYTYKQHSYPTDQYSRQPIRPTEPVSYSYAGAVNTRNFGPRPIPQRLVVPGWVQPSYTPYRSGVYPQNQMNNYY